MRLRVRRLPEPKPNERELLREALLRLPRLQQNGNPEVEQFLQDGWGDPEMALRYLYAGLKRMRLENENQFISSGKNRRPEIWYVTLLAGTAYQVTTGKPVRRISKYVTGAKGKQEAGPFAGFLAEVFEIVGIKASAASQARKLLDGVHDKTITLPPAPRTATSPTYADFVKFGVHREALPRAIAEAAARGLIMVTERGRASTGPDRWPSEICPRMAPAILDGAPAPNRWRRGAYPAPLSL